MIKVTNIRVRSFDLGYLDVYWDLEPSFESALDYEFVLEKSDNEFGPYFDLTVPMVDQYHVRDTTVTGYFNYYNKIYYRIRVQKRGSSEQEIWPKVGGVKLAALPDLAALEMARLNNLRLKEFSGRKLWVFPRRQSGQRCGVCWDEVSQRKMRSGCPTCHDTSWVGGYHAPVQTHGMLISPNEQTIHANFGDVQSENTTLLLGNYPEVSEGDLIIEAENVRWRVASTISKIKKSRALIRQQVALHRIPTGDIEYRIPLNLSEEEIKNLVASPERNYTNPQTLESAKLTNVLDNVFSGAPQLIGQEQL